jgi:hypothetical protein
MGIEPTLALLPELENKWLRAMANPKCDGCVNFRGIWGHVGIRRRAESPARAYQSYNWRSIRRLSTALRRSFTISALFQAKSATKVIEMPRATFLSFGGVEDAIHLFIVYMYGRQCSQVGPMLAFRDAP